MIRRRWVVTLLVALAATACDTSGYAFKVDKSITITAPKARAEVSRPLVVRWTDAKPPAKPRVAPADPTADYYAVFLDREALAPHKRLSSLVKGIRACSDIPGCPTTQQLEDLGVYLVAARSLTIPFVRDLRSTSRGGTKDVHELTIVRMRGDQRSGESAYLQTFFVRP
jgi:hypothetical protein